MGIAGNYYCNFYHVNILNYPDLKNLKISAEDLILSEDVFVEKLRNGLSYLRQTPAEDDNTTHPEDTSYS